MFKVIILTMSMSADGNIAIKTDITEAKNKVHCEEMITHIWQYHSIRSWDVKRFSKGNQEYTRLTSKDLNIKKLVSCEPVK